MKKKSLLILLLIISLCVVGCSCEKQLEELPKPEITSGIRGEQFGIDKNINEQTIDDYLNREDSVYVDVRMLKDPGNYEAIGGDSYLSGFVKGFEVVPFPLLVNVSGLPEEVGKTYTGKDAEDLFSAAFASTYYRIDNCELNLNKIKREAIR